MENAGAEVWSPGAQGAGEHLHEKEGQKCSALGGGVNPGGQREKQLPSGAAAQAVAVQQGQRGRHMAAETPGCFPAPPLCSCVTPRSPHVAGPSSLGYGGPCPMGTNARKASSAGARERRTSINVSK